MKKKAIILGTAVLLIVILSIRLISNKEKIDEKKKIPSTSERTVTVITDRIKKNEISGTLQLAGTTIPKTEVVLQSEIAAQVKEVNFKLGDRVSKGKLLIQLDDRLRFLALENAKLNLSRMEDEYNKTKNLFDGKASSETQLRDAKLNYESAKVTYEQAKKQFEQTKIIAPQNGFITQKMVENGSFVNVGTQMAAIVDISQLKALVNIAEGDVYRIKQGQKAQIKTSVFPGVSFTGEVSFISAKGDKAHNYPVEITINNQPSHQLKSGTFVTVEFNFGGSGSALTLPKTALIGSAKDPKVYVVSNNIASLKKIILGRDFGNSFEVIEGLKEGDAVVMDGQVNLTDGDNVTIINKEAGK
jgi:RND family efflux transporter MFP subunit